MPTESANPPGWQRPPSDELLRLINESVADFAIFSIDPAGLVTSWNIGAERLLGYRQDEIIGKTARAKTCEAMKGLTEEMGEDLEDFGDVAVAADERQLPVVRPGVGGPGTAGTAGRIQQGGPAC